MNDAFLTESASMGTEPEYTQIHHDGSTTGALDAFDTSVHDPAGLRPPDLDVQQGFSWSSSEGVVDFPVPFSKWVFQFKYLGTHVLMLTLY